MIKKCIICKHNKIQRQVNKIKIQCQIYRNFKLHVILTPELYSNGYIDTVHEKNVFIRLI